MITRLIIFMALIVCSIVAKAQSVMLPLDRHATRFIEGENLQSNVLGLHTAVKPLSVNRSDLQSLQQKEDSVFRRKQYASWVGRKLFNEHLIRFDTAGFIFNLDPIVHFEQGQDGESNEDLGYYQNTRGFRLDGNLGKKLSFESSFFENQAILPNWVDSVVNVTRVVPGSGRVKVFGENAWDYSMASGVLTFDVTNFLQVQGGHGKHFIGQGYRSLLLSDNAFNYPFLKARTTFGNGKFQLTNIWASLQSLDRIPQASTPEALFQRKAATFHHLSWAPLDWLGLGLFEAVQWQRWDSTGTQPYNVAQTSPVPGLGTVLYGLDDVNNALIGLEGHVRVHKKVMIYGQFIIDDGGETGDQQGVKVYNLLPNLFLLAERNQVRSGALNHQIPLQNYGHYAQPLGHPLGANFQELVFMADYRWRSWFLHTKYITADRGPEEDGGITGRNIFYPEAQFGNFERAIELNLLDVQVGYLVHPRTNVRAFLGITQRMENTIPEQRNQYIYVALKTSLTNAYYDF